MVMISREEVEALLSTYSAVRNDLVKLLDVEFLGGHVEIYDVYLRNEDDVGVALYYDTVVHESDVPLIEYTDYTDAPFETARLGFFKTTGEPLRYTAERVLSGYRLSVRLDKPIMRGERLEVIAKAHMGGKVWLETPHHRKLVLRGSPTEVICQRSIDAHRYFHVTAWKMPEGTQLLGTYPQPWKIYAENNRLNILFVFYAHGTHTMYLKYLIPYVAGVEGRSC